ncbi:DegV family protein [Intestinibacter sp.]|uniref:DegV family protein n=1 Tax=Intestinibacter sp. TaxID=1965304 RepID=UPI002A756353|nr:DegV family protein [Intestinibacter sp.]MDY2735160.1 DegV family protein [Intestinibacter sp.]
MRNFIISTDSTGDLPNSYLEENNILVHPLYYILEGEEYIPGEKDMHVKDFYQALKNGKMPKTSAANPESIIEKMRDKIENGYDILHISFSSGLSSSYNTTKMCADDIMEQFQGAKIIVVDSLSGTVGQGFLVMKAVEMKNQGKTIDEISTWLNENKKHIIHEFIVSDLNHLFRGGRLSKSQAVIGTVLNINPILHMDDQGKLANISKVRGRKKALNVLADNIEKNADIKKLKEVFISHGDCIDDAEYLADRIKNKYGIKNIMIQDICPTIGAHTAQGTVVVAYFGEKR